MSRSHNSRGRRRSWRPHCKAGARDRQLEHQRWRQVLKAQPLEEATKTERRMERWDQWKYD